MPEAGAAPACLSLEGLRLGSPGCSFLSSAARSRSCRWFLSESDATSAGFRELWPAPQVLVTQSRLHPAGGDAAGNDRAAGYSVVEVRLGVTPSPHVFNIRVNTSHDQLPGLSKPRLLHLLTRQYLQGI